MIFYEFEWTPPGWVFTRNSNSSNSSDSPQLGTLLSPRWSRGCDRLHSRTHWTFWSDHLRRVNTVCVIYLFVSIAAAHKTAYLQDAENASGAWRRVSVRGAQILVPAYSRRSALEHVNEEFVAKREVERAERENGAERRRRGRGGPAAGSVPPHAAVSQRELHIYI
jgi:hypothetical protein